MKNVFLIIVLISFSNVHARVSGPGPGWGMEIDPETFGSEMLGRGGVSNNESMGVGGSGRIMSDFPGSFDIGGFEGIRTIELPTSFEGNFGGRF